MTDSDTVRIAHAVYKAALMGPPDPERWQLVIAEIERRLPTMQGLLEAWESVEADLASGRFVWQNRVELASEEQWAANIAAVPTHLARRTNTTKARQFEGKQP